MIKTLLRAGISEPELYGDLVYELKKLKLRNDFSCRFRKVILDMTEMLCDSLHA